MLQRVIPPGEKNLMHFFLRISDDFGLRSPVIQKPKMPKNGIPLSQHASQVVFVDCRRPTATASGVRLFSAPTIGSSCARLFLLCLAQT